MSEKRTEWVRSVIATDSQGKEYHIDVYQDFHASQTSLGQKSFAGLFELLCSEGAVRYVSEGVYNLITEAGNEIILTERKSTSI